MIIINEDKLEQAKQKLQEQKSQYANKIETIMIKIQDEDEYTKSCVKELLEDKYSNLLKKNEKEIEVVEYIVNHKDIIINYIAYREDNECFARQCTINEENI